MNNMPRWLRIFVAAMTFLVALYLAAGSWFWVRSFFPGDRLDMTRRSAHGDRVFTEVTGFVDMGIHLQAVDFPHTWSRPEIIGDLYWPEIYRSREVFWSRDLTVIAIRTVRREDPRPHFTNAYDFTSHRSYGDEGRAWEEVDAEILGLFDLRGGVGDREMEIVDEKDDRGKEHFPLAGWLLPLVLLSAGTICAWRNGGRRGVAAEKKTGPTMTPAPRRR